MLFHVSGTTRWTCKHDNSTTAQDMSSKMIVDDVLLLLSVSFVWRRGGPSALAGSTRQSSPMVCLDKELRRRNSIGRLEGISESRVRKNSPKSQSILRVLPTHETEKSVEEIHAQEGWRITESYCAARGGEGSDR